MTNNCPGCGFVSGAGARYCRMCGAALARAGGLASGGDEMVSPLANTAPLAGALRPTEELSPHDTGVPLSPPTARVSRAALEDFRLRAEETGEIEPQQDDERTLLSAPSAPRPDYNVASLTRQGGADVDDEVTIHVRPVAAGQSASRESEPAGIASQRPAASATENRALRLWAGLAVFGVVIILAVAAAVGIGWYATRPTRDGAADAPAGGGPATTTTAPAGDARRRAAAVLAESDKLLAAGKTDEAVARLREAAALDPTNAEPHRRLARLLIEGGARRTGIEELRAVLRIDPGDTVALRELAAAQAAEGLHGDAADSYRRLFESSEEARADDRLRLSHAEALRLAGRDAEAREVYRGLASSPVAEVARASRVQLARLSPAADANSADDEPDGGATPAPTPPAPRDERARNEAATARTAATAPANDSGRAATAATSTAATTTAATTTATTAAATAALSPRERYERGLRLWPSNRRAALSDFAAAAQAGRHEANYYLGLNLVEGRDPRSLRRGELVAALTYFQRARRGRHSADARRREEELGREYDRRRQQ